MDTVVFTHLDLDGLTSYLVLCWFHKKELALVPTTPARLEEDFNKWCKNNEWGKTTMYFTDLDVSSIGPLIDTPHTIIFDHHQTNIYPFSQATTHIKEYSSCCKLIYDSLKKELEQRCNAMQKTLLVLADDWDSYRRAVPISEDLNIVLYNTQNKVQSFINNYFKGFVPFSKEQHAIIKSYKAKRKEYLDALQIFSGDILFEGEKVKVASTICDSYVNECCDYLFEKTKCAVAIAVMVEKKRIAVRRNKNNKTINVATFVQRVANGGGHEFAAGGELTEEFMLFTKQLQPYE